MKEFDIIHQYFTTQKKERHDVLCGIGDDAALINIPSNQVLAITTDTLVENVHFLANAHPFDIGYKSLAVNLSDLAAMGATPAWATLALTLPKNDNDWLQSFRNGFFTLAKEHHVALIGGDLTRGPLTITLQIAGYVPPKKAILRSQAKPNDLIYVTGSLGDAGLALKYLQAEDELKRSFTSLENNTFILNRLNRPTPRIAAGIQLRDIAHAAIDISDGLAADLMHILKASNVGATLFVETLPLSEALKTSLPLKKAINLALTAGDDYELCFTIPADKQKILEEKLHSICQYTCIGIINQELGLHLYDQNGKEYHDSLCGYQHF